MSLLHGRLIFEGFQTAAFEGVTKVAWFPKSSASYTANSEMPDDDYERTQREEKQWGGKKSGLLNWCNGNTSQKSQPNSGPFLVRGSRPSTWWLMNKADVSDRGMFGETFSTWRSLEESCWSTEGQDASWSVFTFSLNSFNPPILPVTPTVKIVF